MRRLATLVPILLCVAATAAAQTRVLVDGQSPAPLHSYAETGGLFGDILADWGFTVEANEDQDLDAVDLGQYDALVLSVLWSCHGAGYSAGEVAAIADYVAGGGGLLLLYETPGFSEDNLEPVSSLYGVTLTDWGTNQITPVIAHPVTANVDYVNLTGPGSLTVASPSEPALVDQITRPVVAVHASRRVVTVADVDWVLAGNAQPRSRALLVNVIRWLAGTPTAVETATSWSAVKALFGD